jgi:hypothetical protein
VAARERDARMRIQVFEECVYVCVCVEAYINLRVLYLIKEAFAEMRLLVAAKSRVLEIKKMM